jgi:hypothetical protein
VGLDLHGFGEQKLEIGAAGIEEAAAIELGHSEVERGIGEDSPGGG